MAENEKPWEEKTYDEQGNSIALLQRHAEYELAAAKVALLKALQEQIAKSSGAGIANIARSYATLNGTYTGGGAAKP